MVLTLDFPSDTFAEVELSKDMLTSFNIKPVKAYKGKAFYMLVYETESQIASLQPNLDAISKLPCVGVIVTAKGNEVDFVSRFFAPQSGINEDPVTGSAHTLLTPYWSNILNKKELTAVQLSARKGHLTCKHLGERVEISGKAQLYLTGEIYV